MSAKTAFARALLLAVCGAGLARGDDPLTLSPTGPAPREVGDGAAAVAAPAAGPSSISGPLPPSRWMTYTPPDCCGPVGGDGPIATELYLQFGFSLPASGGFLKDALETGLGVQGGGRVLCLDAGGGAAWLLDLSLTRYYNNSARSDLVFQLPVVVPTRSREGLPIPLPAGVVPDPLVPPAGPGAATTQVLSPVTVRALNRTSLNLGVGREWYVPPPVFAPSSWDWRLGVDGGGRWGTASLELNDPSEFSGYRRIQDVFGSLYVGFNADVLIPCGCCTWEAGCRLEWDNTWIDVLPESKDYVQFVNFLFNVGVRY